MELLIIKFLIPFLSIFLYFYLIFLIRKTKRKEKIPLILLLSSGTCWLILFYFESIFTNKDLIKLFIYLDFIAAALVAYFVVLFFLSLLNNSKKFFWVKFFLIIPILITIYIVVFRLFNTLNTTGKYDLNYYFLYFGILCIYFLFISSYLILKNYQEKQGIERLQIKYILLGYLLSIIPALVGSLLEAFFADSFYTIRTTSLVLVYLTVIFPIFATYAITRYRFMDIRLVMKKGTAHLVSLIAILATYTSLIFFGQQTLVSKYQWNQTATTIAVVLIIALSVEPLRRLVIKAVNFLLYSPIEKEHIKNREEAKLNAQKLLATSTAKRNLEEVINNIVCDYLYFISPNNIKFLHFSEETKKLECAFPRGGQLSWEIDSPSFQYMNKRAEIVLTQEIPYLMERNKEDKEALKLLEKFMRKNSLEAAVPIGTEDNVLGVFLLGSKIDNEVYTKEDYDALRNFRASYTPWLFNIIIYKEAVERIKI